MSPAIPSLQRLPVRTIACERWRNQLMDIMKTSAGRLPGLLGVLPSQAFVISAGLVLVFTPLLSADLSTDKVDISLPLKDGPGGPNTGVDLQISVNPDGSVNYGAIQMADSTSWTWGDAVSPKVPPDSTITSSTFSFAEPRTSLVPWPNNSLQLTASAFSTIDSVKLFVYCSNGMVESYSASPPSTAITFVPCSSSFLLEPFISGTASVQLTGWTVPTQPGTYEDALWLEQSLDYSLTVDYTPSGVNLPEPGFFWLTGLVAGMLLILRIVAGANNGRRMEHSRCRWKAWLKIQRLN